MPYSHYALAHRVASEGALPIVDEPQYYLGAFMPDIRYFTKLPRENYHFPLSRLEPYRERGDVHPDFLLGYAVHLLIDEEWESPAAKRLYQQSFPPGIRGRMTRGLQAVAFELYCLRQPVDMVRLKPVENALTESLGVTAGHIDRAVRSMQSYLERRDLAGALEMAKETQLFPRSRLKTVERVVAAMRVRPVRACANAIVDRASLPMLARLVQSVLRRLELEGRAAA